MFKKKKKKFLLTGTVVRTLTDTIDLTVEAVDEDTAYEQGRLALEKFPAAHSADGITFCYIRHREYHENELESLTEQEDEGARA